MRLPGSLRARLTLVALLAVALGGAIAGGLLLAAVERDGRRAVDEDLRGQAAEVLRGPPGRGRFDGDQRRGPGPGLLAGSGTFVQLAYGGEVLQQGDVPPDAPPPPDSEGFATVEIDGNDWRSLTVAIGPAGEGRLQVLSTLARVDERVSSIRRLILLIGLLALVLVGLAAWFFTTLAVRPLARLQAGAARVSGAEDLSTPLPDEGPDEVRSLAGALNGMLARLQASSAGMARALEATRRFAADAGHELRTPLTSLRANLDTLERNPDLEPQQRAALLRESTAEQERIVHLLDGLQALARGDAAEALRREDVELGDLVDAAVFSARRRHPGVTFELRETAGEATLNGWAGGLRLIVDNLLDNAALHGGDQVVVELEDGWLLRVFDDGPGIPAQQRDRLLQPFARGDTRASGSGLGLAIVAQQVALHGGELRLVDGPLGGLAVEVRLPATA